MKPIDAGKARLCFTLLALQLTVNDIASTCTLDALDSIRADRGLYRHRLKRLAGRTDAVVRNYDTRILKGIPEECCGELYDLFDSMADTVGNAVTKLRLCIKNDMDRQREPHADAISHCATAYVMAKSARKIVRHAAGEIYGWSGQYPDRRITERADTLAKLTGGIADMVQPARGATVSESTEAATGMLGSVLSPENIINEIVKNIYER